MQKMTLRAIFVLRKGKKCADVIYGWSPTSTKTQENLCPLSVYGLNVLRSVGYNKDLT